MPVPNGLEESYPQKQDGKEAHVTGKDRHLPYVPCGLGTVGPCYARPTRCSWPLKQGSMGDISQLKKDLEHTTATWQQEVHLKLMGSVWGAHVRTPEED